MNQKPNKPLGFPFFGMERNLVSWSDFEYL